MLLAHTKKRTHPPPRHRHLVAGPMFVLSVLCPMIALAVWKEPLSLGASILAEEIPITATTDQPLLLLPQGVRGHLSAGSQLLLWRGRELRLQTGTLLLLGEGRVTVDASSWTLEGVSGAFSVTVRGDHVSIAALTTPVVLREQGRKREPLLVVPPAMQWQGSAFALASQPDAAAHHSLRPLPAEFLETQLTLVRQLPPRTDIDGLPASLRHPPRAPVFSLFSLPVERQRTLSAWRRDVLGHVRFFMESRDGKGVQTYLEDPELRGVFPSDSPDDDMILALLLARAEEGSLLSQLLPLLLQTSLDTLLFSLHPRYSSSLAMLPSPPSSPESEALFIHCFPFADTASRALPSSTVARWRARAEMFLDESEGDRVERTEEILETLAGFPEELLRRGYPERAQRYREHLLALLDPVRKELSTAALANVEKLEAVLVRGDSPLPFPQEKPAAPHIAPSGSPLVSHPRGSEEALRQMLLQAGAMFTLHTRLLPQSGGAIRVESVLFAVEGRDSVFEFVYEPSTSLVTEIHRDGGLMPFPLPWEEFVRWMGEN